LLFKMLGDRTTKLKWYSCSVNQIYHTRANRGGSPIDKIPSMKKSTRYNPLLCLVTDIVVPILTLVTDQCYVPVVVLCLLDASSSDFLVHLPCAIGRMEFQDKDPRSFWVH
jgi:hypothetical protein